MSIGLKLIDIANGQESDFPKNRNGKKRLVVKTATFTRGVISGFWISPTILITILPEPSPSDRIQMDAAPMGFTTCLEMSGNG